jgi:hypothetical protein
MRAHRLSGVVFVTSLLLASLSNPAQQSHSIVQACLDPQSSCTPIPTSLRPEDLNEMLDSTQSSSVLARDAGQSVQRYLPDLGSRSLAKRYIGTLEPLRSFYGAASSLYLDAGVWFNFPDRTGEGAIQYWAEGPKYRMRATVDPRLGLSPDFETAYDGERYQLLYLADSRLSLWKEDPKQTPAPFPNPLFLPLSFLGFKDDCHACEPTLGMAADATRWSSRLGLARGQAGGSDESALILPGSSLDGEPFYYRVVLAKDRENPSRIDWVRPDGRTVMTLELSRYQPVEGSSRRFPYHIVVTSFDRSGARLLSVHYMVKTLRLNAPVEPKTFTIPFDSAKIVIDEDVPTFLKHYQLTPPE